MQINWNISERLSSGETAMAVIGLGYVGLPIALEFGRKIKVIGFDIKPERIELMKQGIDPSEELDKEKFEGSNIKFTSNPEDLKKASFYVISVPTPIDISTTPDLRPLLSATHSVAKALKSGDYVVYESTVYPGCTEEDCLPLLEEISGLKLNLDFKLGYSPERINPGDRVHTLRNVKKIVSGSDETALNEVSNVYKFVVDAGLHSASSIKVAEAAKIIENTQRDLNIAFMNELSIIFSRLGINTTEVLEAAATKWNFLKFYPGLVGGHCIGVDPYYLVYKAKKMRYHAQIITAGRFVNDSMGSYVAKQTAKRLLSMGVNLLDARILVMGATYKEDVTDIRNSRVPDIIKELESYCINVETIDPGADAEHYEKEYGIQLKTGLLDDNGKPSAEILHTYDAVIIAVNHKEYLDLDENFFASIIRGNGLIVDVKNTYQGKIRQLKYWSL
jgi:UDP-N-acetyl-D-glucosamine/UDP-N-acetyl-D-galactosamine dehydrogenase